jgi:hypothetical protein
MVRAAMAILAVPLLVVNRLEDMETEVLVLEQEVHRQILLGVAVLAVYLFFATPTFMVRPLLRVPFQLVLLLRDISLIRLLVQVRLNGSQFKFTNVG